MPSTVDTNLARTRIQSLFRYLAELQKLKTPPKVQLKAYSWQLRLADVPDLNEVTRGEILPPTEDGEVLGDDYILKVRKPEDESGAANKLFEQFLELWQTMERESEKVELMLGEGQVLWNAPQGAVDHPVLLQTLSLEFDPAVPEFTVRETDREPFLYSPLMRWCDVDEPSISEARAELQEAACHPLGGPETTEFLRRLQEKLWSDGKFIEEPSGNERAAKTVKLIRDPILYLGTRSLGFSQAIDAYLDAIPKLETFPHSLLRVVGIETPSKKQSETSDLLMTMPSNPEQERVARRLEESSCVLVQGPPGTGKTHTIANLIGHLLAQGKSILVTSHASKALRVVRDMVIPELRPLCVSVLDQEQESRRQLEQAVKGIVARFTTSDIDELDKLAQTYYDRRQALEARLAEAQKELLEARHDEYRELIVGDDGIHPARAAKLVAKGVGTHDWIPGPVENEAPLPLTSEEFEELYQLNREVPAALEEDLETSLPALEDLLTEGDFRKLLAKREELRDADPDFGRDYWERDDQTLEQLATLREAAERVAVSVAEEGRDWALECMRVGRLGGTHQETWEDLVRAIETSAKSISSNEAKVLSSGAEVKSDTPVPILLRTANEILEHLKAQKDIGWLELEVKRRHWKTFLSSAIVNGSSPKTPDDIAAVVSYLEIKAERDALKTRWERQMVPKGAPGFDQMGEQPEQVCLQYCQPMRDALDWERKIWAPFHETLKSAGLRWEAIEEKVAANPSLYGDFLRIREAIDWQLKPALKAREAALELKSIDTRIREQEQKLMGFTGGEAGSILEKLRTATANLDVEEYARAWNWMSQLYSLQETVERRNELLGQVEAVASEWADALRAHSEPHNEAHPPGEVDKAWKHIQWKQQLAVRHKVHFDELQQEILRLKTQLRTATAHYVENKTWANQLRRTGVRQQQALVGWLDLMRKIGSGKGKRAPRLKAMAREKLADCRDAVPVWIMPLSRLAESYHPGESMFDVVILDEASQCDVTGLLAFALGKEVLVVGDHEQVSPEAVGLSFAAIEAMIDEFLAGIPNRELYDGRTSVYDLARQSFGGTIRLLEHFRCVEEIIAFSNHLCYQGEIQPLREGTQVLIKPPTVPYRVPEANYEKKVNKVEAQTIAALVVAACEQPEYEGATMGVISLVGEEQALAVERLLTKHLELTEYQERRIVCGNAAQFQGDERDVIFLSVVETASDGPLPLRTTDVFTKRFNVAASRAKDQMWVVYSLDPVTDLKEGDLRRNLIEHMQDPRKTMAALSEATVVERSIDDDDPEYRYQIRLRRALEKAGYRVKTNHVVGNYRIDLVVEGRGGRVAITCDGANEHPPERLSQELEREAVLERLGWKFLRARASGYYLDPEKTIARVLDRIEELELEPPDPGEAPEEESRGEELRQRVIARAEELLREWGVSAGEEGEVAPSAPPSRASSIAERLEKKIKKIRLLSGEESKSKKETDDESEDSGEESGEARRGKRLTGWRNLLPLQKPASRKTAGGTGAPATKKSGYFIPIDKKAKPGSKKTDSELDEKSADGE